MNEFTFFALKSILSLGLFALIYRIVMMKEGNFHIRRLYLLLSVIISIILPLIRINLPGIGDGLPGIVLDEIIVYSNGIRLIRETSAIPFTKTIQILYFAVAGFLLFRIVIQIITILVHSRSEGESPFQGVRVVALEDKNISYSFFRSVFIGKSIDPNERRRILSHEMVHAKQLHSLDVLFIEVLSVVLWFNPLIWWFRNEIRNVHEYLADEGALEDGHDRKEYQITLLEHLIGSASLTITNRFNYSLIKNRIAMMNQSQNKRKNTWKVFLLIPVSMLVVLAFACTQKTTDLIANPENPIQNESIVYMNADEMPVYTGGFEAMSKFIAENIVYPVEARDHSVSGKVFVQFIIDTKGKVITETGNFKMNSDESQEKTISSGITVVGYKPLNGETTSEQEKYISMLKDEAIRVISLLPAFEKPGMKDGKPVNVAFTIPISFTLQ